MQPKISLKAVNTVVVSWELQSSSPSRTICVIIVPSMQEVKNSAISSVFGDGVSSKNPARAGSMLSRSPICRRYYRHSEPKIVLANSEVSFCCRASQGKKQMTDFDTLLCCTRRSSSISILQNLLVSDEEVEMGVNPREHAFATSYYLEQSARVCSGTVLKFIHFPDKRKVAELGSLSMMHTGLF